MSPLQSCLYQKILVHASIRKVSVLERRFSKTMLNSKYRASKFSLVICTKKYNTDISHLMLRQSALCNHWLQTVISKIQQCITQTINQSYPTANLIAPLLYLCYTNSMTHIHTYIRYIKLCFKLFMLRDCYIRKKFGK